MTNFDIRQFAISSVGAIALSATCVLAAVGPARASAPSTTAAWVNQVEGKIVGVADPVADRVRTGKVAETMLALRFTAEGHFAGASVARSSGDAMLDRRAVAFANDLTYPALPGGAGDRERTVTMRLAFGADGDVAAYRRTGRKGRVDVMLASAAPAAGFLVAAK